MFSKFLRNFQFHIVILLALLIGTLVLINLIKAEYSAQEKGFQAQLQSSHEDAIIRAETAINSYATIVSSIRAYVKSSASIPSELEIQAYLNDIIDEINYRDSIVVSLLDSNHEFIFVVTPHLIDPQLLVGSNLSQYRSQDELNELTAMMKINRLKMLKPINLVEGWAALPFVFPVERDGQTMGYIAANVSLKHLLKAIEKDGLEEKQFICQLLVKDSIALSQDAVFDGSTIYNTKQELPLYQQLGISNDQFIRTALDYYGLQFHLGTAYKSAPPLNHDWTYITSIWYLTLCLVIALVLIQYTRIRRLRLAVAETNRIVIKKNQTLQEQLEKIQTLIKEVHHRVKNNMQIISSLLSIQSGDLKSKPAINALESSKLRIQSMALVHKKLYEVENLDKVNTADYVQDLVDLVKDSVGREMKIAINIDIPNTLILNNDQTIPLGLIFNELMTNSIKHAFSDIAQPEIWIKIKEHKNGRTLLYSDNGIGLSKGLGQETKGIGLELISMLSQQLNGELTYEKSELSTFKIIMES